MGIDLADRIFNFIIAVSFVIVIVITASRK